MAYQTITERSQRPRSGIILGGVGCGGFEILQDGTFTNWSAFNNQPLGTGPHFSFDPTSMLFFLLRVECEGRAPFLKLLQIEPVHGSAAITGSEFHYIFPWISGVDRIRYEASVPFARLDFEDDGLPLQVELEAWSPFIPRNAKDSSLPCAFFDFRIRSRSDRPLTVSVLGSLRNASGYDQTYKSHCCGRIGAGGFRGFEMGSTDMDESLSSWGTMALLSEGTESTCYTGWEHLHPYYERLLRETVLPEVDDTAGRNAKCPQTGKPKAMDRYFSTTGRTVALSGWGDEVRQRFVMTWHFPNLYAKDPAERGGGQAGYLEDPDFPGNQSTRSVSEATSEKHVEGHYHSNFFASARDVAMYAVTEGNRLERQSRQFHEAFYASTLDREVLDQINSHLNTFRSSSWLTKAGNFGILEGINPWKSFAGLTTVDVAMYGSVSTSALFPELDRTSLAAHARFQDEKGTLLHCLNKNFVQKDLREASGKRVDMPGQFAYLTMRAAFWANDREYLQEMLPHARRAVDYILRERDANGDGLPDMEGIMCSYDNFPMYGVSPYVASQFLAGVAAVTEGCQAVGDVAAAEQYWKIWERGYKRLEATTWNGDYYRLYSDEGGATGRVDEGCMSDQVIGQWAAHLADLRLPFEAGRVKSALQSILERNFFPEQGLRNCTWPDDGYWHPVEEHCWVDQANTCWSGVELTVASLLIYEGLVKEGLRLVEHVDSRHRQWGIYWDHQEFGGHYFRPMSAWSILTALAGQRLCLGRMTVEPRLEGERWKLLVVWADGYGWLERENDRYALHCLDGELRLESFQWRGLEAGSWLAHVNHRSVSLAWMREGVRVDGPLHVPKGESLILEKDRTEERR